MAKIYEKKKLPTGYKPTMNMEKEELKILGLHPKQLLSEVINSSEVQKTHMKSNVKPSYLS